MLVFPGRLMTSALGENLFADASAYWPFSTSRSLVGSPGPTLDFTRAGGAMQYLANGNLGWAPENLIFQSNNFTSGTWRKNGAATVTDTNLFTVNIPPNTVDQIAPQFGPDEYPYEVSFWLMAVTGTDILRVNNPQAGNRGDWRIDLSQISTTEYEYITKDHPAVTVVTDFRVFSPTAPGTISFSRFDAGADLQFRVRDVQVNRGTFVQPYKETTTAQFFGPRFDYSPTGQSLGLLIEESRTNNALRSEEFDNAAWTKLNTTITANQATAPDGTTSADEIEHTTTAAQLEQASVVTNAPWTFSTYVKNVDATWFRIRIFQAANGGTAWFNIATGAKGTTSTGGTGVLHDADIQDVGGGWYRVWVAVTPSVGTGQILIALNDADGSVTEVTGVSAYIWGAQMELGSFPTSYIPTTTAQVVRAADVCDTTDVSWFNQTEGRIYFAGQTSNISNDYLNFLLQLDNGLTTNRLYLRQTTDARINALSESAVSNIMSVVTVVGATQPDTQFKTAIRYKTNDGAIAANGALGTGDVLCDFPLASPVTHLRVGAFNASNLKWNGHIATIAAWNTGGTDDDLTGIT